MTQLIQWKDAPLHKPLLLNGARQVGKTWLLQEFGRRCFENTVYVSLDQSAPLRQEFQQSQDLRRIIRAIQVQTKEIITPGKTLLILDEIQECPAALTSLKYFCEQMPELAVTAAGSLLGLSVHHGTGFPVGKVRILDLYPLSFGEYMSAIGEEMLFNLTNDPDPTAMNSFSEELANHLKFYLAVGGMPAAVAEFTLRSDLDAVRMVQNDILRAYELDMSKHVEKKDLEAVFAAWASIPRHLSQENKRFVFGHVRESGRAREFASAITWLTQAGIAVRTPRISKAGIPLRAYAENSSFKLFLVDVGLLGAMAGLHPGTILHRNEIFEEFKGALTEQYVCQELLAACGNQPFYWSAPNARAEVDFLVQRDERIWAIEAKAEENLRSKSLRAFHDKNPHTNALRFSLANWRDQGWMRNIPLYALHNTHYWQDTFANSTDS